ncbi:PqqD family protein [Marinilongibacter aquaticus]|uniref:PqqD family protein n=1 Tax=Marinilongibacter aquaticus TaxID=2975157 RepID=UPI0021BDEC63|nr:PqqD family protein [Marinilongibacter aquaticus]UBM59004.1 PqqD family protein [Marinilongibacter aquaticus]
MKKYTLSENQVSSSLSGESVILNHEKGTYYNLNEVGSFIWSQLENKASTLNELAEAVAENFEIETDECLADVEELIKDLLDEKLVVEIQ